MISSTEWLAKPGSVGRPRPELDLRILDDAGHAVPTGEEGTVCFGLGDAPFEYKDDPTKTAESRHAEGYFTMGDVGYVDADGYLFLCDRRADVIISGGVNIYPAQIESVLLELDCLVDCCVVGIRRGVGRVRSRRDRARAGRGRGRQRRGIPRPCVAGSSSIAARPSPATRSRAASTSRPRSRARRRASSRAARSAHATGKGRGGDF
ncbi:MAG: AMP-binding protein [Myxococcota bacterium]